MPIEEPPVTPELEIFIARYRGKSFPFSNELFRGIEENEFPRILRYPGTQPCREIAEVYRNRAIMTDADSGYTDNALHEEFSQIADTLAESPDEPCRLWMFQGKAVCFSVFEMEHSECIGGCLKQETPSLITTQANRRA